MARPYYYSFYKQLSANGTGTVSVTIDKEFVLTGIAYKSTGAVKGLLKDHNKDWGSQQGRDSTETIDSPDSARRTPHRTTDGSNARPDGFVWRNERCVS